MVVINRAKECIYAALSQGAGIILGHDIEYDPSTPNLIRKQRYVLRERLDEKVRNVAIVAFQHILISFQLVNLQR